MKKAGMAASVTSVRMVYDIFLSNAMCSSSEITTQVPAAKADAATMILVTEFVDQLHGCAW
jgi:hypothetical protein